MNDFERPEISDDDQVEGYVYEAERPQKWSITDGTFEDSDKFPDLQRIDTIHQEVRKTPAGFKQRIYYAELMLYVIDYCNPGIFTDKEATKAVGRAVQEATDQCVALAEGSTSYLEKDLRAIASKIDPKKVPAMQALKALQEKSVITHEARVILSSIVRAIYLKQERAAKGTVK